MDFVSLRQVPGWGDGNDSGNWPVLLVRKKTKPTLSIEPSLDAAWFGRSQGAVAPSAQSALFDSGEHGSFQLVSRRRLRWARALFVLLFGAVVALLVWEARHLGLWPG